MINYSKLTIVSGVLSVICEYSTRSAHLYRCFTFMVLKKNIYIYNLYMHVSR